MRVLALLSYILGNRIFSQRLLEAMTALPGVEVYPVALDGDTYRQFPAPRLLRKSAPLESQHVFRAKLRALQLPRYDAVIANGYGLLQAARPLLHPVPMALATDTTPALQLQQKPPLAPWKRTMVYAWHGLQDRAFRDMLRGVSAFLPMSGWCARSLTDDYGVADSRMAVTSCPQKYILDMPPSRHGGDRFHLLFVGNDFVRKGGDILVSIFNGELQRRCRLTLVSNDPSLFAKPLPEGVTLVSGVHDPAALRSIYESADLLVLPTRQDQYPQVICEAFAHGLPCFASAVGGIPELIEQSAAGELLPAGAPPGTWSKQLLRFAGDVPRQQAMRHQALSFAKERLSMARMRNLLAQTLTQLQADASVPKAS